MDLNCLRIWVITLKTQKIFSEWKQVYDYLKSIKNCTFGRQSKKIDVREITDYKTAI